MPSSLQGGLSNNPTVPKFLEDFKVQKANIYFALMAEVCFGRTSKETLTYLLAYDYNCFLSLRLGSQGLCYRLFIKGGQDCVQLLIIFLGLYSLFKGHLPLLPIVSQPGKKKSQILKNILYFFFELLKKYPSAMVCLLSIYLASVFSIWTLGKVPP